MLNIHNKSDNKSTLHLQNRYNVQTSYESSLTHDFIISFKTVWTYFNWRVHQSSFIKMLNILRSLTQAIQFNVPYAIVDISWQTGLFRITYNYCKNIQTDWRKSLYEHSGTTLKTLELNNNM